MVQANHCRNNTPLVLNLPQSLQIHIGWASWGLVNRNLGLNCEQNRFQVASIPSVDRFRTSKGATQHQKHWIGSEVYLVLTLSKELGDTLPLEMLLSFEFSHF